jgi:hypothetical protein
VSKQVFDGAAAKSRYDTDVELHLPETSLVVFVDDTGHERLVEGHPVYGLGGCAD